MLRVLLDVLWIFPNPAVEAKASDRSLVRSQNQTSLVHQNLSLRQCVAANGQQLQDRIILSEAIAQVAGLSWSGYGALESGGIVKARCVYIYI